MMRNPSLSKISTFSPWKHFSHNEFTFLLRENVLIMSGQSTSSGILETIVEYRIAFFDPNYFCRANLDESNNSIRLI